MDVQWVIIALGLGRLAYVLTDFWIVECGGYEYDEWRDTKSIIAIHRRKTLAAIAADKKDAQQSP